jgi:hypothetical protein
MPEPIVIGWREWVCVPSLHLRPLKAKIDSGAKTCALHAFYVEPFERDEQPWVRFGIHPRLHVRDFIVHCESPLIDRREVTDSGGHRELRCVIATTLQLGNHSFSAEVTLTDRETLQYRMLIGRNALRERFLVDSTQSFALGKPPNGAGPSAGKPL